MEEATNEGTEEEWASAKCWSVMPECGEKMREEGEENARAR